MDAAAYSQPTSEQITVTNAGDYLLYYNDSLQGTGQRTNIRVRININGTFRNGGECKSHYMRGTGSHEESSCALVFPLQDLNAGDIISMSVIQEGNNGTINDEEQATIIIRQLK